MNRWSRLRWFFSCIVAGLVAAALTGFVLASALMAVVWVGTPHTVTRAAEIIPTTLPTVMIASCVGVVLGGIPAVAIMCFTRARYRPWHSLPLLVAGAAVGYASISYPISMLAPLPFTLAGRLTYAILEVAGPTLGALAASLLIRSGHNSRSSPKVGGQMR
jgi:hypothetical protein